MDTCPDQWSPRHQNEAASLWIVGCLSLDFWQPHFQFEIKVRERIGHALALDRGLINKFLVVKMIACGSMELGWTVEGRGEVCLAGV